MTTVQLQIDGMSCGHCVHAIRTALSELAGVQAAEVKIGAATVQIDESLVGMTQLLEAVADAGYDAREAA